MNQQKNSVILVGRDRKFPRLGDQIKYKIGRPKPPPSEKISPPPEEIYPLLYCVSVQKQK